MIPDDAVERLMDSAHSIGKSCDNAGVQQWEIFASQGYGHSLDIEAGKISMASGGGDGGFDVGEWVCVLYFEFSCVRRRDLPYWELDAGDDIMYPFRE